MRIYMQTPPSGDKPPRFYHLHLQEDLLEGWTLVKESGYQGSAGKVSREFYENRDDALDALLRNRDRQINRGFRVVFAEGDTGF